MKTDKQFITVKCHAIWIVSCSRDIYESGYSLVFSHSSLQQFDIMLSQKLDE